MPPLILLFFVVVGKVEKRSCLIPRLKGDAATIISTLFNIVSFELWHAIHNNIQTAELVVSIWEESLYSSYTDEMEMKLAIC